MTPNEIRAIRKAARLTQEGLAKLLNLTLSTVQAWEGGRRNPTGPSVKLLEMLRDGTLEVA